MLTSIDMKAVEHLFDYLLDGIVVLDRSGIIQYANRTFADIFQVSQKRIAKQEIKKTIQLSEKDWEKLGDWSLLKEATSYLRFQYRPKSEKFEMGICVVPWLDDPSFLILIVKDLSVEANLQSKYQLTLKQNEQIYRAHQKKLFEVLFLSAIAEAADVAKTPEELFDKFLPKIVEVTDLDAVGFFLLQEKELKFKGFATKRTVTRQTIVDIFESYKTNIEVSDDFTEPAPFELLNFHCAMIPLLRKEHFVGLSLVIKESGPISTDEIQMIWIMGDHIIAHLERIRLREDILQDALTKVNNTRFFHEKLVMDLEQSRKSGNQLSLIIFDIDHFKKVNDTYGHQTGDLILQHIAQVAKNCLRTSDSLARIGGEEFAVILPQTGIDAAKVAAERIRSAIEKHVPDPNRPHIKVTSSFGIGNFPNHAVEKTLLIEVADKSLYVAKNKGRNRVVTHGEE